MKNYEATEIAYKNGYEKGYADGVQVASSSKQLASKWIPVTERLPEPLTIVFIWDSTNKRATDAYMTRHMEWVGISMSHEVTHWMPLPEPPEGE